MTQRKEKKTWRRSCWWGEQQQNISFKIYDFFKALKSYAALLPHTRSDRDYNFFFPFQRVLKEIWRSALVFASVIFVISVSSYWQIKFESLKMWFFILFAWTNQLVIFMFGNICVRLSFFLVFCEHDHFTIIRAKKVCNGAKKLESARALQFWPCTKSRC